MSWRSELRERLRTLTAGERADAELMEEMRFHLEMEAERLAREEGLDPAEARRRAAIAFGGVDKHGAAVRDERGFGWFSGMSLDMKLGARMVRRYPVLALASGVSIAMAVALAAAFFEFFADMARPRIPFDEGGRIVVVQNWDRVAGAPEGRTLKDFEIWREEARSIGTLSAVATGEVGVTTDDGGFEVLRIARLTASMLELGDFNPQLGRRLEASDDVAGALLPVLIGHDVWQSLFESDPSVVGRTLRVGEEPGTVVGVMPEGFGFPVNQQLWAPLRERGSALEPRTGLTVRVYGRLAPGVTREEAQAELTAIGERMAGLYPATHEHLRPRVRTVQEQIGMGDIVRVLNVPFILFLLVVCANVATLVFARTVTRSGELAVRSALGASRRRLVAQLVAESLVLTTMATAAGLVAAQWGLRKGMALFWEVQQMAPPYFFDDKLSAPTIVYALVLSVLAAVVIGGIPALKATGPKLRPQLVQSGTSGSIRFGAVSTVAIVLQVALCVAFLPAAVMVARDLRPEPHTATSFPADRYLSGRITLQSATAPGGSPEGVGDAADPGQSGRAAAIFGELKQRLAAQPGVKAVAFSSRTPGFNHPVERIQLEADTAQAPVVRVLGVDEDFFDVVDARIVAGRGFDAGEHEFAALQVVVSEEWAAVALAGRSPVGQRIRFNGRNGNEAPWHEIVGVVAGMERATGPGEPVALYRPLRVVEGDAVQAYLQTALPPVSLVRDVHDLVQDLHPALAASEVMPLDQVWAPVLKADRYFLAGINTVSFVILAFALFGIYSLLSFTVSQRAREIAIRAALGARPRRVIAAIFWPAGLQIGLGVLIGAAVVSAAIVRSPATLALVVAIACSMVLFGLAGCVVPALRALRIQPTEALK
jgi:putative ABC transport system permease protein